MNTIILISAILTAGSLLCAVIVLVKFSTMKKQLSESFTKTLSEQTLKEFDRLEGKISEENRNSRMELASSIEISRKEQYDNLGKMREETSKSMNEFRGEMKTSQQNLLNNNSEKFDKIEEKLGNSFKNFLETLDNNTEKSVKTQNFGFEKMEKRQTDLIQTTENKLENLRKTVENKLKDISESFEKSTQNMIKAQKDRFEELDKRQEQLITSTEKKLDEMRATVDEKLQKTLNERLGQSFKIVSEQLENVQKGLGEMKNLATDVGGLKNALTNVKVRGNFGELQLKSLLEQMLSPEQYDENIATVPNSSERVEFAIKLPGKDDGNKFVYLPIDSKFPKDVYDQYIEAVENNDTATLKNKSQQFVATVQKMAKDIKSKYISVPSTTDFAIMFVPVENIYAEIIRRAGLLQELRDEHHILVTGPTTLGALLSSLQMGFKTLAIQKRSSDVWTTLGAVKTEFEKFGGLLDKAKKNIDFASATIEELQGKRTRAINRKLREVEALPSEQSTALLPDLEDE